MTPLVAAPRLGAKLGVRRLYLKNDAVCFPSLSFKDRVVAVALAQAQAFGFQAVSCSSTGNLANAVAAQAARLGFDAWIFIPVRSRAGEGPGHACFRRASGAHRGQLRSGEPAVLADRASIITGDS